MYSNINCGAAVGISGIMVSVEADISAGLPGLTLVGYLSSSVKEASERVRTALKNAGISLPPRKITVNLSPADLRKDGTGYDLAIAVAILSSMQYIPESEQFNNVLFLGELGLNGDIRPVTCVLPIVDYASGKGIKEVIVPFDNVSEAVLVEGIKVIGVKHITDVIDHLNNDKILKPVDKHKVIIPSEQKNEIPDISEIKGQLALKRGMEIAVAGFHNILMSGAAGSGKSMIAKCLPGIMPDLSYDESLEITKIYSVSGKLLKGTGLIQKRPFRSPHATISEYALIGGGVIPKPGEVSLADCGVLFLDEFPEYRKSVIEQLRGPLEDRKVSISRVNASYTFPANFMLVAAMNPCPCGMYPDRNRCTCTDKQIKSYQNKVSYPIMDRIDIRMDIRPLKYDELFAETKGESSEIVKNRIVRIREIQTKRFLGSTIRYNSEIPQKYLTDFIKLTSDGERRIKDAFNKNIISARGYYKLLKLSRTIADINDHEVITENDITEALFYRNIDIQEGNV